MDFEIDRQSARLKTPGYLGQLQAKLDYLELQLADGRPYLMGEKPSIADFSANVSVSCMRLLPMFLDLLSAHPRVDAWQERIAAVGPGDRTEITSKEALNAARSAAPEVRENISSYTDHTGLRPGDQLRVTPADMGKCPTVGELVLLNAREIAIRRNDPDLGELVVHFPRERMDVEVVSRATEYRPRQGTPTD